MPASYDQIAPRYDRSIAPLERWFLTNLRREAIAALPSNARILELGAGTGMNFAHYGPEVRGVATEPSREMIRIAAAKTRPTEFSLTQNCAEQLPFGDPCFDAAIATLVMCSVKSPEVVFKELRRVVKSGGTISLLEHVRPDGLLGYVFDLLNELTTRIADDHFNRRTAELAGAAGLRVTKSRKVGFGIINVITCEV